MVQWIAFLTVLFAAFPALAQSYSREGFSAGASVSAAFEDFDEGSWDDTGAIGLFAGYRFHPNIGIDARFEQTGDFDGDIGPFDVEADLWTLSAMGQFFLLTEQFQPYLLGGFGIGEVDVDLDPGPSGDETDPFARVGVGLDSYATPNFVIGAEAAYNFGIDDLDDWNYWTLSALLRYRF